MLTTVCRTYKRRKGISKKKARKREAPRLLCINTHIKVLWIIIEKNVA